MQLHRGNLSIQSLEGWPSNFLITKQTEDFPPTAQKTVIFLAGQVPGLAALQACLKSSGLASAARRGSPFLRTASITSGQRGSLPRLSQRSLLMNSETMASMASGESSWSMEAWMPIVQASQVISTSSGAAQRGAHIHSPDGS